MMAPFSCSMERALHVGPGMGSWSRCSMGELDSILRNMTPDFFGGRRQKTSPEALFNTKHAVFLDVRSVYRLNTT